MTRSLKYRPTIPASHDVTTTSPIHQRMRYRMQRTRISEPDTPQETFLRKASVNYCTDVVSIRRRTAKEGNSMTPSTDNSFLESYRGYLLALAHAQLDRESRGKLEAADIVQQTLLKAHAGIKGLQDRNVHVIFAWVLFSMNCSRAPLRWNAIGCRKRPTQKSFDSSGRLNRLDRVFVCPEVPAYPASHPREILTQNICSEP